MSEIISNLLLSPLADNLAVILSTVAGTLLIAFRTTLISKGIDYVKKLFGKGVDDEEYDDEDDYRVYGDSSGVNSVNRRGRERNSHHHDTQPSTGINESLLETYVRERDYWKREYDNIRNDFMKLRREAIEQDKTITDITKKQEDLIQRIILLESLLRSQRDKLEEAKRIINTLRERSNSNSNSNINNNR